MGEPCPSPALRARNRTGAPRHAAPERAKASLGGSTGRPERSPCGGFSSAPAGGRLRSGGDGGRSRSHALGVAEGRGPLPQAEPGGAARAGSGLRRARGSNAPAWLRPKGPRLGRPAGHRWLPGTARASARLRAAKRVYGPTGNPAEPFKAHLNEEKQGAFGEVGRSLGPVPLGRALLPHPVLVRGPPSSPGAASPSDAAVSTRSRARRSNGRVTPKEEKEKRGAQESAGRTPPPPRSLPPGNRLRRPAPPGPGPTPTPAPGGGLPPPPHSPRTVPRWRGRGARRGLTWPGRAGRL